MGRRCYVRAEFGAGVPHTGNAVAACQQIFETTSLHANVSEERFVFIPILDWSASIAAGGNCEYYTTNHTMEISSKAVFDKQIADMEKALEGLEVLLPPTVHVCINLDEFEDAKVFTQVVAEIGSPDGVPDGYQVVSLHKEWCEENGRSYEPVQEDVYLVFGDAIDSCNCQRMDAMNGPKRYRVPFPMLSTVQDVFRAIGLHPVMRIEVQLEGW